MYCTYVFPWNPPSSENFSLYTSSSTCIRLWKPRCAPSINYSRFLCIPPPGFLRASFVKLVALDKEGSIAVQRAEESSFSSEAEHSKSRPILRVANGERERIASLALNYRCLGGGGYPNNPYANSLSPIFLLGCLKKCLMLREIFISPSHFRFLGMERTCFFFFGFRIR